MKIVERSIGDLKPYPQNAKKHDQKQIDNVANSIRRFGWQQPIVIDRDDVVVIGHCRLLAAKKLGLETVPVTVADDLTPDEIKELRIADNKTNESPWDFDTLQLDVEGLEFEGFDFEGLTEFAEESGTGAAGGAEDDDYQEPESLPARAKLGDVFQLGGHRLMCGDSTNGEEIDKLLNGAFMRMTVTSPPYGVGKDYEEKGIEPWKKTISGVISAIAHKTLIICWNIADLFSTGTQFTEPTGAYSIQMMDEAGYGMLYNRIWKKPGANLAGNNPYYTVTTKPAQDYEYLYAFAEKESEKHLDKLKEYLFTESFKAQLNNKIIESLGGPKFMHGHWFTNHQFALIDENNYTLIQQYCIKNGINAFLRDYADIKHEYLKNTIFSHNLSDDDFSEWGLYGVWEFNTVHERLGGHAAAYPVELPARYIKIHSYEGDTVLDPFGGTGTTLIACEQLNRTCYMMELDPHYVDVIVDRWEKLTGKKAVLLNDGE